jgi:hypothetical protein
MAVTSALYLGGFPLVGYPSAGLHFHDVDHRVFELGK